MGQVSDENVLGNFSKTFLNTDFSLSTVLN